MRLVLLSVILGSYHISYVIFLILYVVWLNGAKGEDIWDVVNRERSYFAMTLYAFRFLYGTWIE